MAKDKTNQKIDKLIKFLKEDFVIKKEFQVSQKEVNKRFDEIMTTLDKQTVILQRLDQERIFTLEFIRRVEKQVERNSKAIKLIKTKLKIS